MKKLKIELYGNHVRIRIAKNGFKRTPKTIGFVHNPDVDAGLLFDEALLA